MRTAGNPDGVQGESQSQCDWPEISEADYAYLTAPREQPSPCPWCGGRLVHPPACTELRLSWQVTMPFGKHKGRRLGEIPHGYLEWLANVATVDADLKSAAQRQLEASEA